MFFMDLIKDRSKILLAALLLIIGYCFIDFSILVTVLFVIFLFLVMLISITENTHTEDRTQNNFLMFIVPIITILVILNSYNSYVDINEDLSSEILPGYKVILSDDLETAYVIQKGKVTDTFIVTNKDLSIILDGNYTIVKKRVKSIGDGIIKRIYNVELAKNTKNI